MKHEFGIRIQSNHFINPYEGERRFEDWMQTLLFCTLQDIGKYAIIVSVVNKAE